MRYLAALILVILFLSSSAVIVSGQTEEKIIIIEENIDYSGPFWYSVSCQKVSCPGLSLEITDSNESYRLEDNHILEWAGILNSGSSITISSDSGTFIEDIVIEMLKVGEFSVTEDEDLIDTIPSPGNQDIYFTLVTSDNCMMGNCNDDVKENERKLEFVGLLENYSDKDSIKIEGEYGDIIQVSEVLGNENLRIEVWHRNNQEKVLISSNLLDLDNDFIEYPEESELWLRIISDSSKELFPYKFSIYRNNQSQESPIGGELTVPWTHGDAFTHQFSWTYESYISKSDQNGDSLLFNLGPDTKVGLQCFSSSNNMNFEIYLNNHTGISDNISLDDGTCPEIILTHTDTISVEFWIKSEETAKWNISFMPIRALDAGELSDAPETRWLINPDQRWSEIQLDKEITGSLHNGDNIDIYIIKILDVNGSRIYLEELVKSQVNYTIQEINQNTGQLVNTSNGETIILPYGNHSLRIERRADLNLEVHYNFRLEYLGEYEKPEIEDYQDLSWMFDDFYKLIGVLFLTPLIIVIFWNRKAIINRENIAADIQLHEMRRLQRIRERLSEELNQDELKDERIIASALNQLGESPWNSINEVWGKPILTHMTEQIDISAWRIAENNKNLLLGIKVGNWDWKIAAMKVKFPEGSKLTITDVSPKHLFQGDEIFLDTMRKNSQIFIRISMVGGSTNLGLEFSGLVDGKPLAAVPNKVINW